MNKDRYVLEGLVCHHETALMEKLDGFAADGIDKLQVVSDFDLTATQGLVSGRNSGTWDVIDRLMPPEGVAKHTEIYQSFRPIETAGLLTSEIAHDKWAETLDLITGYKISVDDLREAFLGVAMLREGFKELFDYAATTGVPTTVLSSGIKNIINIVMEHYDVHPTHIVSNQLIVDPATNRMVDWRRGDLIHILNKHEKGHAELERLRIDRPNGFVLGDVPADTQMMSGDSVVRVRVIDPRQGESHILADVVRESFDAGFDIVTEHSLAPMKRLLEYVVNGGDRLERPAVL